MIVMVGRESVIHRTDLGRDEGVDANGSCAMRGVVGQRNSQK